MRLWLDKQPMPEDFDVHVKTVKAALEIIKTQKVTHISLADNLGEGHLQGRFLASYIQEYAYYRLIPRLTWSVHSADPTAMEEIAANLKDAERYWQESGWRPTSFW